MIQVMYNIFHLTYNIKIFLILKGDFKMSLHVPIIKIELLTCIQELERNSVCDCLQKFSSKSFQLLLKNII